MGGVDKILKVAVPVATIVASAAVGIWNILGSAPAWLSGLVTLLAGVTGSVGLNNARRALNRTDPAPADWLNPPT